MHDDFRDRASLLWGEHNASVPRAVYEKLWEHVIRNPAGPKRGLTIEYIYDRRIPAEKAADAQAAKDAAAKRESDAAAERQRREDERIRQILSATGHNYLSDEVRARLLAILSDVACNGI